MPIPCRRTGFPPRNRTHTAIVWLRSIYRPRTERRGSSSSGNAGVTAPSRTMPHTLLGGADPLGGALWATFWATGRPRPACSVEESACFRNPAGRPGGGHIYEIDDLGASQE